MLLSPPEGGPRERELLLDAFDSNWIAPAGPDLDAFETELEALTGVRAVAALSSGTAALQLALMAVGVGAGDDVMVSTLTFGASAFAPTYLGARPCFVDCEPSSWHLDPDLLDAELTQRASRDDLPAAVIAVDLYGSVCDGDRIAEVCRRFDVPLVVDAAESIGATRDGVAAAHRGDVSTLSFNGNKMVTTGGGGAIASDDVDLVDHARYLSTQARQPVPWYEHEHVGHNFRLGNLNAAVGRGQLATLAERIAARRAVREGYEHTLGHAEGVRFQQIPDGCEPNHWLTTIALEDGFGASVERVLEVLRSAGVEARYGFKPMHLQPVFAGHPVVGGAVAADLFTRSISLPSGSRLDADTVEWIAELVLGAR